MTARKKTTAPKKPTPAQRLRERLRIVRGDDFKRIRQAIKSDKPLSAEDKLSLVRVLDQVAQGIDPRPDLGIAARGGAPNSATGFHHWMALHYIIVLCDQPLEKVAASIVAEAWGVHPNVVRRAAKAHGKAAAERLAAQAGITEDARPPLVRIRALAGAAGARLALTTAEARQVVAETDPRILQHGGQVVSASAVLAELEGEPQSKERDAVMQRAVRDFWEGFNGQVIEGVEIIERCDRSWMLVMMLGDSIRFFRELHTEK